MRRLPPLAIAVLALVASRASTQAPATYRDAAHAWDRGEYVVALDQFARLLRGPESSRWHDSIALVTGELYRTVELASDGTRPTFSPDGRFILYERGAGGSRVTRVHRAVAGFPMVTELPGAGASMSPSGGLVAWILRATTGGPLLAVRALDGGPDVEVSGLGDWLPSAVTFGLDDTTMYVTASRASDASRNDILQFARSGREFVFRRRVSTAPGFKSAPVQVSRRHLVHATPAGIPVRLPGGMAGWRSATSFAIVDLETGDTRAIDGASPSVSADGSTVAWLARTGATTSIMVAPVAGGTPVAVKTSNVPLDAPAVSPDGSQVAFQFMPTHDWELGVVTRDGTAERRLTREIQHDLMPRWLDGSTILAVMGEARHRRSFLYDAGTGARTRLFHNNSVRTIAPEYEWEPSADGALVLVVAERDGNTVSPERGVHVVDRGAKVTTAGLLARVDSNLAAERARREQGAAMFAPIARAVEAVVREVDPGRIYGYEKALFDFDSKHITMPGNAKAGAYLADMYRGFGYDPALQAFAAPGALGGRTANVLAVLRGTVHPELVYVVSSHFDSRAEGPGADDNTSGTAALLEAARVLAKHPQPATIIFASFTGEEAGLLGSREFVRQAVRDSMKLVGALNNDMLGWSNDGRLDNTIRYSNPGIRDIQHAAARQFSAMITYDALYYKNTDAAAYYEAYGDIVGGIGSYPVLGNPHYHQPHDVLETINHQLVAEASRTTVATLMLLASSPSRLKGLAVARGAGALSTVSWTPAPERDIARYVVTWGPADRPESNRRIIPAAVSRLAVSGLRPGWVVQVRAVNRRGLAGWDWARATVDDR